MTTETSAPLPAAEKPKLKDRLKAMFEEFGPIAIATYFGLFFLTLGGMAIAVNVFGVQIAEKFGWKVDGTVGTAGTWAIAYGITKGLQPIRILVALVLTPLVAKLPFVAKFRKKKAA